MAHPTRSNDDVLQDLLDVHYRDNVNVRPLVLGRITEYTTRNTYLIRRLFRWIGEMYD